MKKIFSLLLAVLMLVSALPVAYATETTDYTVGTQVVYTAANAESYSITVPASLTPGASGTVTLSGSWASNQTVKVTADKTVTLTNSINAADQKTLSVTFAGMEYAGDNTQVRTYTEPVSVAAMPSDALFGSWDGKFNYNVEMTESEPEVETVTLTITADTAYLYDCCYVTIDGVKYYEGTTVEVPVGTEVSYYIAARECDDCRDADGSWAYYYLNDSLVSKSTKDSSITGTYTVVGNATIYLSCVKDADCKNSCNAPGLDSYIYITEG